MPEKLAFGVEPSKRRYHLRLARYQGLVDAVRSYRQAVRPARPLSLLDVGAGQGRTLQYLKAAGLDEDMTFSGIDNAPKRQQRLFEADRWDYRLADVEQGLPYDNTAFDIVVCEQVLEHLSRPEFILAEIARVLRPGGMAILGVPSFPPGVATVRRHLVPRLDHLTGQRRDHAQVFTRHSFVELIGGTTDLEVEAVQAFRCVSGGILAPLENYYWWYQFNRSMATGMSSLAIEVQVIARKPEVEGAGSTTVDPMRRTRLFGDADQNGTGCRSRMDRLLNLNWFGGTVRDRIASAPARSTFVGLVLTLLAVALSASLLSDPTHRWLYADGTGLFEKFSAWLWLALGLGLVAFVRNTPWWAVTAVAGTCLCTGVIEGGWYKPFIGNGGAIMAIGVACGVATTVAVVCLLRRSQGLREGWVRVLLVFLVAIGVAELFDHLPELLNPSMGLVVVKGTIHDIVLACEEGVELILPVLVGIAALAWAHAQAGKPAAAKSMRV
ncbi:MAG: class I SAM-dependent methyltransferase [Phycisphaeraceae bacterium]